MYYKAINRSASPQLTVDVTSSGDGKNCGCLGETSYVLLRGSCEGRITSGNSYKDTKSARNCDWPGVESSVVILMLFVLK
jgi:hypothetical protein